MRDTEQFEKDIKALEISLSEKQIAQFLTYYEILAEWNQVMNLTAIIDYEEVLKKHFIDSLSLIKAFDLSYDISVIDIGTGAGFPGIPLKIAFPNLNMTLLDSLNKRIKFLDVVIEKLELQEIKAIHGRAEDYAKPGLMREQYDLCVSRAVANLTTLSEYCLPFVKVGGKFISYKSEKMKQEKKDAERAIKILGGRIENQVELYLPDSDIYRNFVVIKKETACPKKYPRKAGLPAKEPLM